MHATPDTPLVAHLTAGAVQVSAGKTWAINQEADDAAAAEEHGVVSGDGDGTVPLLSLGYTCAGPWRSAALNPAGVKVCPAHTPLSRVASGLAPRSLHQNVSVQQAPSPLAPLRRVGPCLFAVFTA